MLDQKSRFYDLLNQRVQPNFSVSELDVKYKEGHRRLINNSFSVKMVKGKAQIQVERQSPKHDMAKDIIK